MGNLVHHRVYHFFFTRPIIHNIHLCLRALPSQISLSLVVNVEVLQSADSTPFSRASGARSNTTVLQMVSLHCSVFEEIGTKSSAMTTSFKECICLMFKITCKTGEPRLEENFSGPRRVERIKPDFHLADFVPGLF